MEQGNIHYQRLEQLRNIMRSKNWESIYFSGSDPHNSEYPATRWMQTSWLSGFTGEAAKIVVTLNHAGLWTDSRYFIQAENQLQNSGFTLHKLSHSSKETAEETPEEWLAKRCHFTVIDGSCTNCNEANKIKKTLLLNNHLNECDEISDDLEQEHVILCENNLIDQIWLNRPKVPVSPILTLGNDITGENRSHKINKIRTFLLEQKANAILLSGLDEIAWTLNVRGSDIDYNPVVISYLLITENDVKWFVKKDQTVLNNRDTVDSFDELELDGIKICDYADIDLCLASLDDEGIDKLIADPETLNYSIYSILSCEEIKYSVEFRNSPVSIMKACKNSTELKGMKEAHIYDGIAMEKFLYWIDNSRKEGANITEIDAKRKIDSLRAEIVGYMGPSFETISAFGKNAALPHYETPKHYREDKEGDPTKYSNAPMPTYLQEGEFYLVDSGGQYMFGTTDLTRTIPIGKIENTLAKEDYTLVLKGMINLASAVFPKGTAGCQLDILARNPLWQNKRNFGHGTGHGVGSFLYVHEGPQSIRQDFNSQAIMPGMVTSDEPGMYREDCYGIRHENLILCKESGNNSFGEWLEFEPLTLCHIDTSAIILDLLTKREIKWLNDYNSTVFEKLSPHLPLEIVSWLKEKTRSI